MVPKGPPGFPHPTYIPLLSPEIRMSKPLEAEKQGLDSPSEHTGGWGGEQGRQGACGVEELQGYGGGTGDNSLSLSLQTLKEMDQTLTIRSGGSG